MKIILFGATGMVGRGVLLEALDHPEVTQVLSVGRGTTGLVHTKLEELVHGDFLDFSGVASGFEGYDACLWCLGASSVGMDESTYTRITHDFTMAAATVLHERNPDMRFCFVSGAGTDDSESGRVMWARVKGKAENALKRIGFREVVIIRPGLIQPMRGIRTRVAALRFVYRLLFVFFPMLRAAGIATSTIDVGKAMIAAAMGMSSMTILGNRDINRLSSGADAA